MVHQDLALRIERLIGASIESYTPVASGYTPAMRLLCRTTKTSFFAKIRTTPLTSQFLRREMHVYNCPARSCRSLSHRKIMSPHPSLLLRISRLPIGHRPGTNSEFNWCWRR